jgi:phosphate transport system protein
MTLRTHFERKLQELRDEILNMGRLVEEELRLALAAFAALDAEKGKAVTVADREVNKARFAIEEKCFSLIVTQQPAARDLRAIITAMNIIVDLERMGDQAKGIAKTIPRLGEIPAQAPLAELQQMGDLVGKMLNQVLIAYAHTNTDLARIIARQDDEVDALYAQVFTRIMAQMAIAASSEKAESAYELLRVARELERFGDLVTNVGERIIYQETGTLEEINVDERKQ